MLTLVIAFISCLGVVVASIVNYCPSSFESRNPAGSSETRQPSSESSRRGTTSHLPLGDRPQPTLDDHRERRHAAGGGLTRRLRSWAG